MSKRLLVGLRFASDAPHTYHTMRSPRRELSLENENVPKFSLTINDGQRWCRRQAQYALKTSFVRRECISTRFRAWPFAGPRRAYSSSTNRAHQQV